MITSLQRTRQTAEVLFPDAELVVADGLKEMDFGVFEGRNYREMEHDPQYRAWVETGCEGRCPGGESKAGILLKTSRKLLEKLRRPVAGKQKRKPKKKSKVLSKVKKMIEEQGDIRALVDSETSTV